MIRRRAVILFVVLVVIMMISLAGMSYVLTLSTESKAAYLAGQDLQLQNVVASGAELLKAFAAQSATARREAGGYQDNPGRFRNVLVFGEEEASRQGRFSIVAPKINDMRLDGIRFGAENESAKLHLGMLRTWEEEEPGTARLALMRLPGMTESMADSILDWIDADTSPRQQGAEAEYYSQLGMPYAPRNGAPAAIEELLLVRDVTRELLFGGDENFNHRLDAAEEKLMADDTTTGASEESLPWTSLVTVYSAERNTTESGEPRIDLNGPDLARLHQQLVAAVGQEWATFIVAYRQYGPYRGNEPASRGATPTIDFGVSGTFRLRSLLDVVGVSVRIRERDDDRDDRDSSEGTLIIASPFPDDPVEMRSYLPRLLDLTTIDTRKVIYGRINIDEAPVEVLASVPGLSEATASQIVTARAGGSADDDPSRQHPTWLLTEGLVDLDTMRGILPYVTSGGDVFRAQIVGYLNKPGPMSRVEVVVDATGTPARVVYWKDLRMLGPAYSREELGAEAASGENQLAGAR